VSTRTLPLLLLLAIFAVACGSTLPAPGSTPPLSVPELKYRVIAQAGIPAFCGPPVVFGGYEEQQAAAEFAAIKADAETYRAIIAHAHPAGDESGPDYQVAVWREWRRLQAISFTGTGSGAYDFGLNTEMAQVTGHVDAAGRVSGLSSRPARLNCPICLAATTLHRNAERSRRGHRAAARRPGLDRRPAGWEGGRRRPGARFGRLPARP